MAKEEEEGWCKIIAGDSGVATGDGAGDGAGGGTGNGIGGCSCSCSVTSLELYIARVAGVGGAGMDGGIAKVTDDGGGGSCGTDAEDEIGTGGGGGGGLGCCREASTSVSKTTSANASGND